MYIATRRARLEAREAGFLVSNKLEQLEFKLDKNYWDLETCRKS